MQLRQLRAGAVPGRQGREGELEELGQAAGSGIGRGAAEGYCYGV